MAGSCYAECQCTEFHLQALYAECRYAECHGRSSKLKRFKPNLSATAKILLMTLFITSPH
jgi:hypothetical protein